MSNAAKINLNSFDSLFGEPTTTGVIEIELSKLTEFNEHPFKVIDDEKMEELKESISENGVLNPILVRNNYLGGYEIISGHRRKYACEAIGKETIPAIVKDLSDDEAAILMVDSNIQREEILPSEKAFAYKIKLAAMKHQGKTSSQVGTKRTDEILAEETGESRNQIQRYIRLTYLITDILNMVDNKKLPVNTAVELSFLTEEQQSVLLDVMEEYGKVPSIKQAADIKELGKKYPDIANDTRNAEYFYDDCISLLQSEKEKGEPSKLSFSKKTLKSYFPEDYSISDIEEIIIGLLENWAEEHSEEI